MKSRTLVSSLSVLVFILIVWSISVCDARPHHSHRHGGHRPGTILGSIASSGSSFIIEPTIATKEEISFTTSDGTSRAVDDFSPKSVVRVEVSHITSVALHLDTPDVVKTSKFHIKSSDGIELVTKPITIPPEKFTKTRGLSNFEGTLYVGEGELPYLKLRTPIPELAPIELRHVIKERHPWNYGIANIGPFPQSTSTYAGADYAAIGACPYSNSTTFQSGQSKTYLVLCDIDFLHNDYPFKLVDSFDSCVQACDSLNAKVGSSQCVAALFVPSRLYDSDNCYLKYAVNNPSAATIGIEGAILLEAIEQWPTSVNIVPSPVISSTPTSIPVFSKGSISYGSGNAVVVPKVVTTRLHGPSQNQPSQQYLDVKVPDIPKLSDNLLVVGVNGDLTTRYNVSLDTGYLEINSSTEPSLAPLKSVPHLSRDGGQGGYLDGQNLFLFCDTGSYSGTTSTSQGNFLGFVSSSLAVDIGMNGLDGKPLSLQDGIGAWSDDAGRMRGLAPLTQGEQAYNIVMQGKGQRYAIWPESSLIPLDAKTSLVFAPIVYDNVNFETRAAVFTYAGATLLSVTPGGQGGPVAVRTVEKLFDQDEIEWGCAGGIRSWGPSGVGGNDGKIYVFGNIQDGILLARTTPGNVADHNSYEYWNGQSWSLQMIDSSSKAFFISGTTYMNIDVFYSPRHLTFIAVYLNHYADNTFYYRYIMAESAIIPPYAPGGNQDEDIVENILKYQWSDEFVLYKAAPGMSGHYIYAGAVHQQYYGTDDIVNGGTRMLLSWTAPTGQDPSTLVSEYQIITAEVGWA